MGTGLLQASVWCKGSHTRWRVFYGTLKAFVLQAARETAAEQEAAELPLLPSRGGFSHRGSSSLNRKASVNKTKAKDRLQSSVWAGAAAGLGSLPPLSSTESCSLPSAQVWDGCRWVGACSVPARRCEGSALPFQDWISLPRTYRSSCETLWRASS